MFKIGDDRVGRFRKSSVAPYYDGAGISFMYGIGFMDGTGDGSNIKEPPELLLPESVVAYLAEVAQRG